MGEIEEGMERVERTRPVPRTVPARVRYLVKQAKGSTRAVAAELGVSQRTVQRWLKGTISPKPDAARRIEEKVRARWQPGVRRRVRRRAEADGFMVHIQARFGYSAAAGSTDDPRERLITQHLPGEVARELYAARDAGATETDQRRILATALQEHYFKDGGRRADGLTAEINDLGWIELEI
ncbi:telomere-protecting terminal protein Tpg [Kitasatospora sp. NPDC088391]|uniref:telomere-protecting terminal protein Tpg n=1 Tax=Kitasatospora sp. NPDC088391 TaxID=3364074 RepID=UPI00380E5CAE